MSKGQGTKLSKYLSAAPAQVDTRRAQRWALQPARRRAFIIFLPRSPPPHLQSWMTVGRVGRGRDRAVTYNCTNGGDLRAAAHIRVEILADAMLTQTREFPQN